MPYTTEYYLVILYMSSTHHHRDLYNIHVGIHEAAPGPQEDSYKYIHG